ncbi:cytochrome b5-like heme/steroid binding domain-containing protein [Syncephalastrum racemosum]|uniref:Cytochrome b5-like heme/steroid binding domain-containing protein n=1 Tax=Syncephalastrum racemosum TaxID=13706 RepID=A0A1X2H6P9_SYNRA|nr:cytochrome b5-like heme/steroid binding domain-containing protein [Syncephalastrum racemosum]
MAKIFSFEDISKHNTRDDLWMVINGKVYDITAFVDEHPGGEEVLVDEGAKDATGPFDDVGHSDDARELLQKYYIGDIDPASAPVAPTQSQSSTSANGAPQGNALRVIIPLVVVLAVIYFRFLS